MRKHPGAAYVFNDSSSTWTQRAGCQRHLFRRLVHEQLRPAVGDHQLVATPITGDNHTHSATASFRITEWRPLPSPAVWGEPQLIIFDCDGVLVDSEVISNQVLAQMLSVEGVPTTLTQARRDYQGLMLDEVLSHAQRTLGRALPVDWLSRYETERAAVFRRELKPVAGAVDTVKRVITAGVRVCVASQGKLSKTSLSLSLTGLGDLFPKGVRFSAYSVAHGKPAPDLFLHAASSMGVAPANCVVVEDTPSGVTAAVSAAMRSIGYAADSDEQALRNAGATQIMRSLKELPGLLGLE